MSSRPFNRSETPLRPCVRLLEANAGTGKTYMIASLVCRFIVEAGLDISRILVVTFTEAATEELKDRVRKFLQKSLASLQSGQATDTLLEAYLKSSAHHRDQAIRRLKAAVRLFDQAAIFTIHGFCQRVLNQYAFESNHLFEPQLLKEPGPLYLELSRDYWRNHFYPSDPFLASIITHLDLSPESLIEEFLKINRMVDPRIIPDVSESLYGNSLSALRKIWETLQCASQDMQGVREILSNKKAFKKVLGDQLPEILKFLKRPWPIMPTGQSLRILKQLAAGRINDQLTVRAAKQGYDPSHPFFERAEDWRNGLNIFRHQHRFYFLTAFRQQLELRKNQLNVVTFDDLLPRVLKALGGPSGERLKSSLQNNYAAALIDEFQDTDPQQYELFRRLFTSPEHHLYFIGDPKQAIYSFRGADIFSYLGARNSARETFDLTTNWRSDPKLVEGINALFKGHATPFVFSEIPYIPSDSAKRGGQLKDSRGGNGAGLKFCYLTSKEEERPLNNGEAKEAIRSAVVREILHLVQGGGRLNKQRIKPGDIAILTRTNQEARDMRTDLSAVNLPNVIHSDQTIFTTEEANTLRNLLYALSEPNRKDWFKAAMTSEWMAYNADEIFSMDQKWEKWEHLHQYLHRCHDIWLTEGIYSALNSWLRQFDIPIRLLSSPEGERKLTNLMHLVELLQKAESEGLTTPQTLLRWYEDTLKDPDRERDDFLMRLETDEEAVQIVTIHKSKGLQYPIVFVPFAWTSPLFRRKDPLVYHDPRDTSSVVFDASAEPSEAARKQHARESISDSLRLLYVALTRAQFRSYLFWGDFKKQGQSSIGYLLGIAGTIRQKGFETPALAWESLVKAAPDGIEILETRSLMEREVAFYRRYESDFKLSAKGLTRKVEPGFRISSFSSLSSGFVEASEEFEDPIYEEPGQEIEDQNIFSLPKGAITGNVIHQILEETDFQNVEALRIATEKICNQYYSAEEWSEILYDQLKLVLNKPLPNHSKQVVLDQIGPNSCLKEAQFHIPATNCFSEDLVNLLLRFPENFSETFTQGLPNLKRQKVGGFLRGFIDLVFKHNNRYYLLDWKSNWLGDSTDDYNLPSLERTMGTHAYYLQYYLYTVALTRYLRQRIPSFDYERDFGGVYYLFVRGMHQGSESNGIFFDIPPEAIIAELEGYFGKN